MMLFDVRLCEKYEFIMALTAMLVDTFLDLCKSDDLVSGSCGRNGRKDVVCGVGSIVGWN